MPILGEGEWLVNSKSCSTWSIWPRFSHQTRSDKWFSNTSFPTGRGCDKGLGWTPVVLSPTLPTIGQPCITKALVPLNLQNDSVARVKMISESWSLTLPVSVGPKQTPHRYTTVRMTSPKISKERWQMVLSISRESHVLVWNWMHPFNQWIVIPNFPKCSNPHARQRSGTLSANTSTTVPLLWPLSSEWECGLFNLKCQFPKASPESYKLGTPWCLWHTITWAFHGLYSYCIPPQPEELYVSRKQSRQGQSIQCIQPVEKAGVV